MHVFLKIKVDGFWYDIDPAAAREPLVICGDYLSLMTDGRFQSPVHRVILPEGNDHRSSFVFFYYPSFAANFKDAAVRAVGGSSHPANDAGEGRPNTMLDLAAADPSALDLPFGEYIMRKWGGVFRK